MTRPKSTDHDNAGPAEGPPKASTIGQFCRAHNISEAMYFKMRQQGRGPDELRLGRRAVRITEESEERWRRKHTIEAT